MLTNRPTVCLATLLACGSSTARADQSVLSEGMIAFETLDYARAVERLERARSGARELRDKMLIARTLAFAHVALSETEPAYAEFRALLALDPTTTLDRTISPRVRAVFERAKRDDARAAREAVPAPLTVAVTPLRPRAGQPLAMTLSALGGASAQLLYRTRGEAAYGQLNARGQNGRIELAVPGLEVKPPGLEYCLQALDERGTPIGFAGTAAHPLAVEVEAAPPLRQPIKKRRWLWGTLGGIGAAGVVAGVLVVVVRAVAPAHLTVQGP